MQGKLQLKPVLKVKQTVTLRSTPKMASAGTSLAVMICLILFIAFNSDTDNAVAGNQQKSFFQNMNEFSSSLANEYNSKTDESNNEYVAMKKSLSSVQNNISFGESVTPTTPKEDFIHIYPKNTSGIFNVEFELPEKGNFIPQIEIVNRKGKVIDRKLIQPEGGKILESFIFDSNLPDGAYIVRVSVNRRLYIRQIVLQKYPAAL